MHKVSVFSSHRWSVPVIACLIGLVLVPLVHVGYFQDVPGDMYDGRLNSIFLEHFFRWLCGRDSSLLSPAFFYPLPGALTFSDNHWGSAWIYSIYRLLGADRYIAFDLWYMTAFVLNFASAHVVLRKLGFGVLASATGAFVFAFAMPVSAKQGHAQLAYRFLVPVAILAWCRFVESRRIAWLGGCAVMTMLQFYMSIYLGFFLVLLLVGWALSGWIREGEGPRQLARVVVGSLRSPSRDLMLFLAFSLVALAGLAVLFLPYVHYSHLYGFQRGVDEISMMLPRVRSYLLADESSIWRKLSHAAVKKMPMRHEHQMFLGLGILSLLAIGVRHGGKKVVGQAAWALAFLVVFTLDVKGQSFYLLFADLPGFDSIRAVSRIILVMLFPVAIIVASAIDAAGARSKAWGVLVGALMALCVAEAASIKPYKASIAFEKAHYAAVRAKFPEVIPGDAIVYVPTGNDQNLDELDGMLVAQETGTVTPNGYSGNIPAGYGGHAAPCAQVGGRMAAAKLFYANKLKKAFPDDQDRPLLVAAHPECSRLNLREDESPFPVAQMSRVRLEITSVDESGKDLLVRFRIENHADHSLYASPATFPVRISWRFVPVGSRPGAEGWSSRVELTQEGDVRPGAVRMVEARVRLPDQPGVYTLNATLVNEGRTWFQDHGFAVQTFDKTFEVH